MQTVHEDKKTMSSILSCDADRKTFGVSDAREEEGANRRLRPWLRENLARDATDGNVFL